MTGDQILHELRLELDNIDDALSEMDRLRELLPSSHIHLADMVLIKSREIDERCLELECLIDEVQS